MGAVNYWLLIVLLFLYACFFFAFKLSLSQPTSFPSFTLPFVSLISLVGELVSGCLELSGRLELNQNTEKELSTLKEQESKLLGILFGI